MTQYLPARLWIRSSATLLLVLCWATSTLAQDPPLARQREQGSRLALELRSQKPVENLTNSGTLRIRDPKGRRRELPVTIVTLVDDQRWQVRYESHPTQSNAPIESLTVSFTTNTAPRYELARSEPGAPMAAPPRAIDPGASAEPFAQTDFWFCDLGLEFLHSQTDFWFCDLGLEFLHWPDQRLIKEELSNGRLCWALDSYNPSTNGYASVRSWVDAEFHALLRAEAYDRQRRKVKEFSTGSFRQVTTRDGRDLWMLKDIRIRDEFRDTRTELIYDLPEE